MGNRLGKAHRKLVSTREQVLLHLALGHPMHPPSLGRLGHFPIVNACDMFLNILCWHTHRATHLSSHVLSSPLNSSTENTCNHKSFSTTKKNTNPLLLPTPHPAATEQSAEHPTTWQPGTYMQHRAGPRLERYIKSNKQLNCCQTISRVYGLLLALPTL